MRVHRLLYHVKTLQFHVAYEQALQSLEEGKQHPKTCTHFAYTIGQKQQLVVVYIWLVIAFDFGQVVAACLSVPNIHCSAVCCGVTAFSPLPLLI
jgi:hypothetical protein